MKPETAEFIAYAIKLLGDADKMLDAGLDDHAARTAYLACFHVARAYTFERNGRNAKTHGGVQTEFFRLSKDDDRSDPELRAFLTTAYHYKSSSDYQTAPEDNPSPEEAREAVEIARRFVAQFALLTPLP
ncbi:MAG: HEPN domain-containing protein [Rhodopila sp.]|nr:HEPN domain-containing protein [Rhodopila sp.]